jgi:dipeptidyl aminopeptidase/acylaminoacyl peptidase
MKKPGSVPGFPVSSRSAFQVTSMYTSHCKRITTSLTLLAAVTATCCAARASIVPSSTIVYSTASSTGHPSKLIVCTYPESAPLQIKPKYLTETRMGDDILNPVFSPDGKKVLVSANRVNDDGTITKAVDSVVGLDLWTVDLQSGRTMPLTLDAYGYINYSWSPDGAYICSVSYNGRWDEHPMADSGQNEYLYLWNVRKPAKKLIGLDVVDYAWSRDSKRIYHTGSAYSVKQPQGKRSSFIYADIQKGRSFIYFSSHNDLYYGRWSPNGEMFAFCEWNKTGYGISILHKGKKTFLNTELPVLPEWSPDSKKIAFFESVPHQEGGEYLNKLRILDVSSGETSELWSTLGDASVLDWTKDSKWIVATRYRSLSPNWLKEVVASSVDNREKTKVLCSPSEQVTSFDWYEVR